MSFEACLIKIAEEALEKTSAVNMGMISSLTKSIARTGQKLRPMAGNIGQAPHASLVHGWKNQTPDFINRVNKGYLAQKSKISSGLY